MKAAYVLFALVLVAAAAFWVVRTSPDQSLIESRTAELDGIYDPVAAGEATPSDFRQLLPRDAIHPIYDPTFRSAETTDWPSEALVIGVELNGEAKAYPVSFLNRREMVIDSLAGLPILVSW